MDTKLSQEKVQHSKRFTLVDREDYRIDLEYNEEFAILHIPRCDLTPFLWKKAQSKLDGIAEFLMDLGYYRLFAAVPTYDDTTQKFVKKLGFVRIGEKDEYVIYSYERTV